jgi:outer membrane lipoprotein-sorting protein
MDNNYNMLKKYITITAIYHASPKHDKKPTATALFSGYISTSSPYFRKRCFLMLWKFLVLFLTLFAFGSGLPNAAFAEVLSINELTAKIQDVYEKTRDIQAHFVQEATIKSMQKTEREEGTVWIKNPKRMYWDYNRPKEKKLIINPMKAWLYVAEDRIVYLQSSDEIFRSRLAVKFLSGIGKLSEDFAINFSKNGRSDEKGNYLLTLTAKEQGAEISHIHLTIDKKTFQILQFSFPDSYGNTTRLSFSDIKTNTGVADSFFVFRPPAGVDIVNQ